MQRYTFGPFSLDTEARVLLRDGQPIPMAGKTFDTLVVLVQNRGRLVDKDELLSRVWPGTVVEEANLSQSIFTVRKILGDTPKDHRYIATVAGRGYQFVAPLTELTSETPQEPAPDSVTVGRLGKHNKMVAISVMAAAVAAVGGVWFVLHGPAKPPAELVERRLTFNSSASPVASAAISRDGNYLAYSDLAGIHVRLLSTGEERLIPTPGVVPVGDVSYIDSWFPDGTRLLAHSKEASGHGSMWAISVMGQSSRKLSDDAFGWEVSPDGTRIAFSPTKSVHDAQEIWVLDTQGDNPQKVLGLATGEFLHFVHWSPDGRRLVYIRVQPNGQSTETCDLKGTNRTTVMGASLEGPFVRSLCWLQDRRMVYSQGEKTGLDANLWQIGVDNHTGMPMGKPKRITRWAGFNIRGLSASADGTRLVLQKETFPRQIYIGELGAGGARMSLPRRLTQDEADNTTTAWTADSKAVLLYSNRNGKWGIYKQAIGQDTAVPLVEGREAVDLPRLSPDGAWVLYREALTSTPGRPPLSRIMRVPANGGLPEVVSDITIGSDYRCTTAPASLCVVFELSQDEKRLTVTAFDPIKGKGKLIRTIEKDANEGIRLALSPDGSTLAVAKQNELEIRIRLLPLSGGSSREVVVKGWLNLAGLDWSADGKGIYVGSTSSQGGTLLYVELKGAVHVVWQTKESARFLGGIASPDGRYLAIWGVMHNTNASMVEGF